MTNKIEELKNKKEQLQLGGGQKRIEKQHQKGKLFARERLNLLFDEGSFIEIGPFVKHRCTDFGMEKVNTPAEGVITGYGTVDGRLVFAYAQDFTVIGGSLGKMHAEKIVKVMDMAMEMGAPMIGLNDSGGARIQEGVDALSGYGKIFYKNTLASGVIPQITAIMGPCAGGAVYSPAITDFIFMVDQTSQMFITGPGVIKTVTGEEVTAEELGGAMTHNSISGVAHFMSSSDEDCIKDIKRLLSFLPSNNIETAPIYETGDDINRIEEKLNEVVPENPNKPYDMKEVIIAIADNGDFYEVQPHFAQNIIVGFIRINGQSVGIIANQPKMMAGCLDINASDKAARFIRTCDAFNIPILNLVDVPGFLPGINQEYGGIIRHGAKMLYAYSESTVPKVTLITRKAYGGAYIGMCNKELGADLVLAWPGAEIAVMGPDGAANIIFKNDIKEAQDPVKTRKEKIEEYRNKFANPYVAAAKGYIDNVIEPATTRPILASAFEMLSSKRKTKPAKKHGNIPL
ncbi:acyl-CoA carboxylase subunit beta [Garciella nitratireducens]|uniref:Propionyl-CoA carboxylase carboxyltransferase subunit n=1 Tax=Garciella nitratireducens DSM 15102 TaxID=1121911 RepID=A0A1T4L6T7_9FIRM|nr:carboxyl transferase domain-containing protein [Garciella nitratireducens]RBP38469.1 propionyl-CoA carboxylase carboxyltransferase subunit [Garciella nitratireducens]SJZ50333.1 propionyl-CoA carboxylase carboxyltransferase subunit [Garciella nitratireducens DSM 15102]